MLQQEKQTRWPFAVMASCMLLLSWVAVRSWNMEEANPQPSAQRDTMASAPVELPQIGPNRLNPQSTELSPLEPKKEMRLNEPDVAFDEPSGEMPLLPHSDQPSARISQQALSTEVDPALWDMSLATDEFATDESATVTSPTDIESDVTRHVWPLPTVIVEELDTLVSDPTAGHAIGEIQALLGDLRECPSLDSIQAEMLLKHLDDSIGHLEAAVLTQIDDHPIRERLRAIRFELARRVALWQKTHSASRSVQAESFPRESLAELLRSATDLVDRHQHARKWRSYLMFGALRDRLASDRQDVGLRDQKLARRILNRLSHARKQKTSGKMLGAKPLIDLEMALFSWAAPRVDLRELVIQIEQFEQKPSHRLASQIVPDIQALRWSPSPRVRALGEHLESNYRNANVRTSISADWVNDMMTQPVASRAIIDEEIAGAHVSGQQRTATLLRIKPIPARDIIQFTLDATGTVRTQTEANSGPATFEHQGATRFIARTNIRFDGKNITASPSVADARSQSVVTDLRTDFDGLPLISELARSYAQSQHDRRLDQARTEVEENVSRQASAQLDVGATKQLAAIRRKFRDDVIGPLNRLSLKPKTISLATTQQRMIGRFRLADADQFAAHTPRPLAPSDSVLSVQVHESAINNAMANLELAGKTYTLGELYQVFATRTRLSHFGNPPEDAPSDVRVTFALDDPLSVRFKNGEVVLQLQIARLQTARRHWNNFIVIANYSPNISGRQAHLSRKTAVSLRTRRMNLGSKIALRAIFNKVLSRNKSMALLPEKFTTNPKTVHLNVNQLAIRDGWLGIAIGPKRRVTNTDANMEARRESKSAQ